MPAPWRLPVRPLEFALFVVLLFAGGTILARAMGVWQNSITPAEYEQSIRAIDSPEFGHEGASVPASSR
jgi:hypothetical protein